MAKGPGGGGQGSGGGGGAAAIPQAVTIFDSYASITQQNLVDMALLPTALLRDLAAQGVQWQIGDRLIPDFIGYAGMRNRLTPDGRTYGSIGGMYSIIDSTVLAGGGPHGSASMVLHETGHAIGNVLGYHDSPQTRAAHAANWHKLPSYFDNTDRGRREFFAESVAQHAKYGREWTANAYGKPYSDYLKKTVFKGQKKS